MKASDSSLVQFIVFELQKTTFERLTDARKPVGKTPRGGFVMAKVTVPPVPSHRSIRFVSVMKCPHLNPSGFDARVSIQHVVIFWVGDR